MSELGKAWQALFTSWNVAANTSRFVEVRMPRKPKMLPAQQLCRQIEARLIASNIPKAPEYAQALLSVLERPSRYTVLLMAHAALSMGVAGQCYEVEVAGLGNPAELRPLVR